MDMTKACNGYLVRSAKIEYIGKDIVVVSTLAPDEKETEEHSFSLVDVDITHYDKKRDDLVEKVARKIFLDPGFGIGMVRARYLAEFLNDAGMLKDVGEDS